MSEEDFAANPFTDVSGPPSAKFENVGDSVKGEIVRVEHKNETTPTGEVKRFPDGKPRPTVVVWLKTPDGKEIRDFVNGRSVSEFRSAVWAAEGAGKAPRKGASYKRTFSDTKAAKQRGFSPEKLYEIDYDPPGTVTNDADDRDLV
jgi:hypothetical protein